MLQESRNEWIFFVSQKLTTNLNAPNTSDKEEEKKAVGVYMMCALKEVGVYVMCAFKSLSETKLLNEAK